jgi:hypothetical protein
MGLLRRAQPLRIWRVGATVPGEWLGDDVRGAFRNTSYALAGLAVSLFGFAVVAPASLHVFPVAAGAGELTLAVVWWLYGDYRSARVERLAGIERVRDFLNARRLAAMYTLVGLAASVELLVVALLAPTDGSPRRHLHLLGLRVSISGPELGTTGLVVFYLILGAGLLLGVISHQRTHMNYSQAHYFKICEELAKKACTLDDLEQAGLSRENAERWLTEAKARGFVVSGSRGTPARKHWELTKKGAAGLRHDGFPGPIHTAAGRRDDGAAQRSPARRRGRSGR